MALQPKFLARVISDHLSPITNEFKILNDSFPIKCFTSAVPGLRVGKLSFSKLESICISSNTKPSLAKVSNINA